MNSVDKLMASLDVSSKYAVSIFILEASGVRNSRTLRMSSDHKGAFENFLCKLNYFYIFWKTPPKIASYIGS